MSTETLQLRSAAFDRYKKVQGVNHVFAAVVLLTNAIPHLSHPGQGGIVIPILEIVTALALIITFIREVRHKGEHHSKIGWVEIAGGLMLIVEGVARHLHSTKALGGGPYFLQGLVLITLGILDGKMSSLPYATSTDEGLTVRLSPFRLRSVLWSEIDSWRAEGKRVIVEKSGKEVVFNFRKMHLPEQAVEWIAARFSEHWTPRAERPSQGDHGVGVESA